jgi:hypothetical protein
MLTQPQVQRYSNESGLRDIMVAAVQMQLGLDRRVVLLPVRELGPGRTYKPRSGYVSYVVRLRRLVRQSS